MICSIQKKLFWFIYLSIGTLLVDAPFTFLVVESEDVEVFLGLGFWGTVGLAFELTDFDARVITIKKGGQREVISFVSPESQVPNRQILVQNTLAISSDSDEESKVSTSEPIFF